MLNEFIDSLELIIQQTQAHFYLLFSMLGLLWAMFILTKLSGNRLLCLGIIPRKWYGLIGIVVSPLLHGNFNHLFFNSIPLLVLGDFILISGDTVFMYVTVYITLISGTLVWCFARHAIHIGASSVITGYWAFLVLNIYQQGGPIAIVLGLLSLYYFAGIFLGIFPQNKGVSWEGHLFGLIAGILTNYALFNLPLLF